MTDRELMQQALHALELIDEVADKLAQEYLEYKSLVVDYYGA